jgi:hypothetical protein
MSQEARAAIANSRNIIYRTFQQRNDIMVGVQTQLIEFLQFMVLHGAVFEVTAIKTDHGDDTGLCSAGPPYCGTHAHGWSLDCWPLVKATPYEARQESDYLAATDDRFGHFIRLAALAPHLKQIGLAGSAVIDPLIGYAGSFYFQDNGDDHIHFGTQS